MKFRKIPVVVEAIQYDGGMGRPFKDEGARYSGGHVVNDERVPLAVRTPNGWASIEGGEWVIKGVRGEFYPCKPDIFAATYEPVEDEAD